MEGLPLPPGIPGLRGSTDPLEAVLGPFPCVRLRYLPYDISLEDILIFFQGLVFIDVILAGQGDAFVVFANPMDFQMALQRSRQTIGRKFIDIGPASRTEYYEAIASQVERERGPKTPLSLSRTRNEQAEQHHSVDDSSAAHHLWGDSLPHSRQGVSVLSSQLGVTSSTSFGVNETLKGQSTVSTPVGVQTLASGTSTGSGRASRPAESSDGVVRAPLPKRAGGGIQVGEHTGFLRMRGLPFAATKEDIVQFFAGYDPVAESVVLTYRNDGRATGEAYIGFSSANDAKRAMELNRRSMGNRYIELFISNKEESGRALARFGNR
ncbi:heterogeneous nuclear ribonucleoprotein F/H [Fistulifera solaris]|uniref:Heterogeneous nuclear ribonucleoprotein F/H n=1 Tax=Fistulifera solaris TaxID=1519565 RepID=A0A1Z5K4V7_FISSO|nr:heterogeneous nuclear ribonucleoprotein F/H [Fistulifera solaris]|eukprot:GAX21274.1 heterogeneous nuclear ribonucleoprotein F/H [Fistulifera solaris]